MKKMFSVICLTFVMSAAAAVEKSIPELIQDLGVRDQGNNTSNTASGLLSVKKNDAVPELERALANPNERIRGGAVRCLGDINTDKSRAALIQAFQSGETDVREQAAYALTWHPCQDAEQVYIDNLGGKNQWHVWHAIQALGEIRSKKAIPSLAQIRDHPPGWRPYYTALVSPRRIESKELPENLRDSVDFLHEAKYARELDASKLSAAVKIIEANREKALPDVFDIYLLVIKGNLQSKVDTDSKSILRDAGESVFPYITIALHDKDPIASRKARELVTEFGWQSKFEKDTH